MFSIDLTKKLGVSISLALTLSLGGCATNKLQSSNIEFNQSGSILETYSNIALANYSDALDDAKALEFAINTFALSPTKRSLNLAKEAWLKSRESYGQSEIFRLANTPIDAEEGWVAKAYGSLEGQLNAWPLDENMIDYTIDANGRKTSGNIIDTAGVFDAGGEDSSAVNVKTITIDAITALNENGGEANVATGYHAIEFLLWGQDQDYSNFVKDSVTKGALTAGQRPLSDFTTDKNAKRRLDYLKVASSKLVQDLELVKSAWELQINGNRGLYRGAFLNTLTGSNSDKNIDKEVALRAIFAGMGVFIKSELANERIAVAVLTPSEEDEHSCFSDNTHRDIAQNYQGFKNILLGTYEGKKFGKAPFDSLNSDTKSRIKKLMGSIEAKIESIDTIAKTSRHFDYQIRPNDPQARVIRNLKNEMRKLGDEMVNVASQNGISLSVDDVTDAEETKI